MMNRKVQKSALRKQRREGVARRETINGVPYHHYDANDSEKHDYSDSAEEEEEMEVGSRYGGPGAVSSAQEMADDDEISDASSSLTVAIKKILRGTKSKLSPQKRKGGEIVERRPSTDLEDGASQSLSSSDRKKVSFKVRDSLMRVKGSKKSKRSRSPPPLPAYQKPDIPLPENRRTVGAQTSGLTLPDGLTDKIEQLLQMKLNGGSSEMSLNDRRYLESLLNHSLLGRQATRQQWKASDGLASTNQYESAESEDEEGFWSRLYKNDGLQKLFKSILVDSNQQGVNENDELTDFETMKY